MFTVPIRNTILLIIALKGKAHGYEIIKEIENITSGVWKPSYGNLYPLLSKLAEEGLIEPHEEYRGKRRIVKYSLTEKGWKQLGDANYIALRGLLMAAKYHMVIREKLNALGYVKDLPPKALEEYLTFLDEVIKALEQYREALKNELKKKKHKHR
jgi:DNA-binding PadR family transcriptional regulator